LPAWIDDELWNDQDTKTLRMFFDILPSEGSSTTVLNATLKLHIKERTGKYIHVSKLYKSCHVMFNCLIRLSLLTSSVLFTRYAICFLGVYGSLNIFYLCKQTKWIRHKLHKLMKSSPIYNF